MLTVKIINGDGAIDKHLTLNEKEAFKKDRLAFLHEIYYVQMQEKGWKIIIEEQ